MTVSIIIATYNERENIAPIIHSIASVGIPIYELIFVDDSSPDGTATVIRQYMAKKSYIRFLERPGKQGFGSAYYLGMQQASGDLLFCMEADFLQGAIYLPKMIQEAQNGADCVLASRYMKGGSTDIHGIKRVGSQIVNTLTRLYLGIPMHDNFFPLRAIKRSLFKEIQSSITNFGHPDFFAQLTYLAYRKGRKMVEIPIHFQKRQFGASKLTGLLKLTMQYLVHLPTIKVSAKN